MHVPFEILSDANLALANLVGLPTFEAGGMILLERLTMIVREGRIEHVLYPVRQPTDNPRELLKYLRNL